MTTPEQTAPAQDGAPSSLVTSWRSARLAEQVRSELKAAVSTCLADAAAKGYSKEELAVLYSGGPQEFEALTLGASPSLEQAVELARACGYRLRISVEVMDDEVQTEAENITTPFEAASAWMAGHEMLKGLTEDKREDILRGVLALYFGQMREKGLYLSRRGG